MSDPTHSGDAARGCQTVEIPGAPLSRHDLGVIHREIVKSRVSGFEPDEVVVSSRRVREGLRAFGIPVRPNDDLALNEGVLVAHGREPISFDFEDNSTELHSRELL